MQTNGSSSSRFCADCGAALGGRFCSECGVSSGASSGEPPQRDRFASSATAVAEAPTATIRLPAALNGDGGPSPTTEVPRRRRWWVLAVAAGLLLIVAAGTAAVVVLTR